MDGMGGTGSTRFEAATMSEPKAMAAPTLANRVSQLEIEAGERDKVITEIIERLTEAEGSLKRLRHETGLDEPRVGY
jgi:hypothetical protein